jgi:hypothetical protein
MTNIGGKVLGQLRQASSHSLQTIKSIQLIHRMMIPTTAMRQSVTRIQRESKTHFAQRRDIIIHNDENVFNLPRARRFEPKLLATQAS